MRTAVALLISSVLVPLAASDWFVAPPPLGDDGAGGDPSAPLASLATAVARSQAGDTIHLLPGLHRIDARIDLPSGVDLIGSGAVGPSAAVLTGSWDDPLPTGAFTEDGCLLRIKHGGQNRIAHLRIDGRNDRIRGGILIRFSEDVRIDHVYFDDLSWYAVWVWSHEGDGLPSGDQRQFSRDVVVRDCSLFDCGWEGNAYSHGALAVNGCRGGGLYRNRIISFDERSGYPIYGKYLTAYEIAGNHIDTKMRQFWSGGLSSQFAMELSWMIDTTVHDNVMNQLVSIVGGIGDPVGAEADEVYGMRFHHNYLDIADGYTVEITHSRMEIDHNVFTGPHTGQLGLLCFGHDNALDNVIPGVRIHHNLFRFTRNGIGSQDGWRDGSQPRSFPDLLLANNTFDLGRPNAAVIELHDDVFGEPVPWSVFNNLVTAMPGTPIRNGQLVALRGDSAAKVDLATAGNMSAIADLPGEEDSTLDPALPYAGQDEAAWFTPGPESPARNAGVVVPGITADGVAQPTLGAYDGTGPVGPVDRQVSPIPALPSVTTEAGLDWSYHAFTADSVPKLYAYSQGDTRALLPLAADADGQTPTPLLSVADDLDEDGAWFGLVFSGYVQAPATGTYHFRFGARAGARLQIQDQRLHPRVFGGWRDVIEDEETGYYFIKTDAIDLAAGLHPFRVLYLRKAMQSNELLTLEWRPPGAPDFTPIPASAFRRGAAPTLRRILITADSATDDSHVTYTCNGTVGGAGADGGHFRGLSPEQDHLLSVDVASNAPTSTN